MLNRHDMLALGIEGRREAVLNMAVPEPGFPGGAVERMRKLIRGGDKPALPAVVRRFDRTEIPRNRVAVGFSSPFRVNGLRLRVASYVHKKWIKQLSTPFEVFTMGCDGTGTLADILRGLPNFADRRRIGLLGSAAQTVVTEEKSWHAKSDIDLLVSGFTLEQLRDFERELNTAAARFSVRFDVEVLLRNGGGVKLAELLSASKTFLVKGRHAIAIFTRDKLYAMM